MTYSALVFRRPGMAGMQALSGNIDSGEELVIRFQPAAGTTAAGGDRIAEALVREVSVLGYFAPPSYAGWGGGTSRGMITVRTKTLSGDYTLRQIANWMPVVAQKASARSGRVVAFASVTDSNNHEEFARTAGGGTVAQTTGPLAGLTEEQISKWNTLNNAVKSNALEYATYMGVRPPPMSLNYILNFDIENILRSENIGRVVHSYLGYSTAENFKAVHLLPSLMRAQNRGSEEARSLAEKIVVDLRSSTEKNAYILGKIREYIGRPGMGCVDPITGAACVTGAAAGTAAAVTAGWTVSTWVLVIGGVIATLVAGYIVWKSMRTNVERTKEYCEARAAITGTPCTVEDFDAHLRELPPGADEALARALNKMAESGGTAVMILAVGAAVLGLGYMGWKLFGGTRAASSASAQVKMKATELRDQVRARLSGGRTPRALPASTGSSGS